MVDDSRVRSDPGGGDLRLERVTKRFGEFVAVDDLSLTVPEGSFISGYPAIPNRDWLKASAIFRKLPELRKTIAELEARLAALEKGEEDAE